MRAILLAAFAAPACRSPQPAPATDSSTTQPELAAASPPDATAAPVRAAAPTRPAVVTDWCIDGLAALDEETCYVLPELSDAAGAAPLLVYLHGIIPPTPASMQKERVEVAVLHAAKRAHAAALIPRGVRGIGPAGARDWWAWPTDADAYRRFAGTLVPKWAAARNRLAQITGAPFSRTYLAGSSNGAYFLTALALAGDLDRFGFAVDGYGAMSGGSPGARTVASLATPSRPFYVGYGAYDESTRASSRALAALLARAGWPVRTTELPVGHGAREEYLDDAFAYWAQSGEDTKDE